MTTGNDGPVTYDQTGGSPDLTVTTSGAVSVTTGDSPLAVGDYTVNGTDSDTPGDTGTWSYTLDVTSSLLSTTPSANGSTVTPATSHSFTDLLLTTGNDGPVTYDQTGGSPDLTVTTSGAVSVTTGDSPLAVGDYTVNGTDSDTSGDTGTWSYTLDVTASLLSTTPTANGSTVTPATSEGSPAALTTNGGAGTVSYDQTGGAADLTVSTLGTVTVSSILHTGSYTATGTDSDGYGDTGTWSYTLNVTAAPITQSAPTSNATTPASSSSFQDQLHTSGGVGAMAYVQSPGAPGLKVSSSGKVTVSGTLAKGMYTATGTDSDGYGDTGTWSYALTVSADRHHPGHAQVEHDPRHARHERGLHLAARHDGQQGTRQLRHDRFEAARAHGLLLRSRKDQGTLAVGTYTVSGTDSDSLGDAGSWSFSLTVSGTRITQSAPTSAATTTAKAFKDQLKVSHSFGAVTYGQASGKPALTVSSSGTVSAPPTLAAGAYKATGTMKDAYGDTAGTWSFSLTVTPARITQVAPTSANVATSKAFAGQLKVSGAHGKVVYAQSKGAPQLVVSSSGAISAPANLARGLYRASGTEFDSLHDTGAWSYTLVVGATAIRQTGPARATLTVGESFSGRLSASGAHGRLTYAQSKGAPQIKVSSSGVISSGPHLAKGTYKAAGTVTDSFGDEGAWSFTLTVSGKRITQVGPLRAATTVGDAFAGHLEFSGAEGGAHL